MRNFKVWMLTALLASMTVMIGVPNGWADDEYEGDEFEIMVKDVAFKYEGDTLSDQVVILPAGMRVTWMNVDPLVTPDGLQGIQPHGVKLTNQDGNIIAQSKLLFADNNTFHYNFSEPGFYDLQCIVHPQMTGKFLVFDTDPNIELAGLEVSQK